MGHAEEMSQGTQPPPTSARGHPMPRRVSPEASVTLRHHRLARHTSSRPEPLNFSDNAISPKRDFCKESHVTGQSDAMAWFDQSNRNAPVAFDTASMDIDPPFYQKQSDSSNEELTPARASAFQLPASAYPSTLRPPMATHSSSADDFRSVIDDLTIENKRLKEELKRFKQFGPDPLRKDRLFEIKFHGLPPNKKQELEATLRDFASSLDGATNSSQNRKKVSKHSCRLQGSSLDSKHASSSSSHSRPVDSTYASMSTGPSSLSHHASMSSFGRPTLDYSRSAEQKVKNYLREIPPGLLPRHVSLTDNEKKKVVVRRLEHLFTGRFGGKSKRLPPHSPQPESNPSLAAESNPAPHLSIINTPTAPSHEPREAMIQLNESNETVIAREELSASNSNGENDTGGNRTGSDSASNEHNVSGISPQDEGRPEQRATRPLDLDPDRPQNPSENMKYIRHLGAMAPEYLPDAKYKSQDVSMDADGWIHLNLLCNLAQLHILNVTPDYIRSAVSERSAKFQLSRDGRKIRWRGGTNGTKFSSDSSGDNSERSPDTVTTAGSNEDGQRKRQRTNAQVSTSSTKFQVSVSSNGFHYKPMFVHHQSSSVETSMNDSESEASYPALENSNINSRSIGPTSRSASSPRKKRRRDGAVIYYTGAPFCLDLSRDPGNDSPIVHMATLSLPNEPFEETEEDLYEETDEKPELRRTASGSDLLFRPLVDGPEFLNTPETVDPEFVTDQTDTSDFEGYGFCWCEHPEKTQLKPLEASLEPCGLGGVTPEDHFAVLVVTRHPILAPEWLREQIRSGDVAEPIAKRIASLSVNSPRTPYKAFKPPMRTECEVLQQRYKGLKPLPLPPPGMFYPPFTETTDPEDDSGFEGECDNEEYVSDDVTSDSDEVSQRVNPHQSDIVRLAEDSDGCNDAFNRNYTKAAPRVKFGSVRRTSRSSSRGPGWKFATGAAMHPDSSAATAGEESGYSPGSEEK